MKNRLLSFLLVYLLLLAIVTTGCGNAQSNINKISMPQGFKISVYANGIEGGTFFDLG